MKKIAILTSILAMLPVIADAGIDKKGLKKAAKKQAVQQVQNEMRDSNKSEGNSLSSFNLWGSSSAEAKKEEKVEKKQEKQKVAEKEVKDSKGNVLDGNPLYMPKSGHFVSVTSVASHTKQGTPYALAEEFGYGITDKLAVEVGTVLWEDKAFDEFAWDNVSLKATYRALDMNGLKLDLVGGYEAGANAIFGGGLYYHSKALDDSWWFDKDLTGYKWTAGVRGGYVASNWTIAGHALFNYLNSESFNWDEKGRHIWELGIDAQYVLCSRWSLLAGAEYAGVTQDHLAYGDDEDPDKVKNAGTWTGMFGVNYNIDATKFIGAYISADMKHDGGTNHDEWEVENGFGFGAKFGIDF